MGQLNINFVTLAILLIFLIFIIRGLTKSFSPSMMFYSIVSTINGILFLISLAFSLYVTRRIFFDEDDGSIFKTFFNILPNSISFYLSHAGIITYIIFSLPVLILSFLALQYLRSHIDGFIKSVSGRICRAAEKGTRLKRAVLGVAIETPKALGIIIVTVIILGFLNIYYPGNPVSNEAKESSLYNLVYNCSASPIINSSLGQKLPAFFWSSVQELSDDIYGNKPDNKPSKLEELGFLRFQYESKSNESIDNKAKEIVGSENDPKKEAYLLYKWVGENISYDWDKYRNVINNMSIKDSFGAIPTFESRKGICEDYSDLYAAMARAVGLKVRIDIGEGYTSNTWEGHAWNEVYIPDEKTWIPLDTTWAQSGYYFDNKNFYTNHYFEAVAGEW